MHDRLPPDLHITVEADHGHHGGPPPVAARLRGCRHRVRTRDLTRRGQWLFIAAVALLELSLLAHFAIAVIAGTVLSANGFGFVALIMALPAAGSLLVVVGEVGLVRTWLAPHRTEPVVLALQWTGAGLLLLSSGLLAIATGTLATALLSVPALLVSGLLTYLSAMLHHRDTCETDPAHPPRMRALLRRA
ncbi:hypothetical protein [Glycomyces paridis]|uniref:Uncharacterized protein n=1 Tax=Glycomyces paridis TaxID=2126555 RepID=A0A4V4HMC2_9ACTN|nr:hypothetical protein [Glycomyces paridis]THV21686.1 hypothetical protein E9998_24710 [Glycomyces paridis]